MPLMNSRSVSSTTAAGRPLRTALAASRANTQYADAGSRAWPWNLWCWIHGTVSSLRMLRHLSSNSVSSRVRTPSSSWGPCWRNWYWWATRDSRKCIWLWSQGYDGSPILEPRRLGWDEFETRGFQSMASVPNEAEELGKRVSVILLAVEDASVREDTTGDCLDGLLDGALESGMRSDLNCAGKRPPRGESKFDGLVEGDGLDHVVPPVAALELLDARLRAVGVDTRHPDGCRVPLSRLDAAARQILHVLRCRPLHVRRVVRRIDNEEPGELLVLRQLGLKRLDGVDVARERDAGRRIAGGDPDAAPDTVPLAEGRGLGAGHAHGHHHTLAAILAAGEVGGLAAVVGDEHGVAGTKHACGIRGRDLARGVADDGVERDAEAREEVDEGDLDGRAEGLGQRGDVDARGVLLVDELVYEGPCGRMGAAPEDLLERLDGGAVDGVGVEELAAHAGPLGPLAGEDAERLDLAAVQLGPDAELRVRRRRPGLGEESVEAGDDPFTRVAADGGARPDNGDKGLLRLGREQQRESNGGCLQIIRRGGSDSSRHLLQGRGEVPRDLIVDARLVPLDDGVRVGAAEAERVDAPAERLTGRGPGPWDNVDGDVEVAVERSHAGVQRLQVQVGRDRAVDHGMDNLQQTGEARGTLGVADDRLDGTNDELLFIVVCRGRCLVAEEGRRDGLRLSRVARLRPRAVGLEVLAPVCRAQGVQTGPAVRVPDQLGLGQGTRHRDPLGAAVRVDARLADDADDRVAIPESLGQGLDKQRREALAAGPSADTSHILDLPVGLSMCRLASLMNCSGVIIRLAPATQAISHSPDRRLRTAWCSATRLDEQAVSMVMDGPRKLKK
ncbi:hypothetical protein ColKHC_11230 [Colletotrichum higginsianum]|nr:hypothetical protein ColKHC_11230 [Colletotrichum higginsianum]